MNKKQDFTKENKTNTLFKLMFILLGLGILVFISYFMAVVLVNRQFEKEREYKKSLKIDPVEQIQYEEILGGSIFNINMDDYYVLIFDFDGVDSSYAQTILNSYKNKEDHKSIYIVNLNNGFNNHLKGDTSNSKAKNIEELKINTSTLINIKTKQINYYIEGIDAINTILK